MIRPWRNPHTPPMYLTVAITLDVDVGFNLPA